MHIAQLFETMEDGYLLGYRSMNMDGWIAIDTMGNEAIRVQTMGYGLSLLKTHEMLENGQLLRQWSMENVASNKLIIYLQ